MKKQFVSPRLYSRVAILFAILALCVLQWIYYQPVSAHLLNSGEIPTECRSLKSDYDAAQRQVNADAAAIDLLTENAVWSMVGHCVVAGLIAGAITMVGTGLVNIPTGAAMFGAAGLYCIGAISVTLTVSIPGYSAAISKLNASKKKRDEARDLYNICLMLHNDFNHPPEYKD